MNVYINAFGYEKNAFPCIAATATSNSRRTERIFFALQNFEENSDQKIRNVLKKDDFFVRKNQKGNFIICKGVDKTQRTLVLERIEDGYRGSSGIHDANKAVILGTARSSSACDGEIIVAAIVSEGNPLVLYSNGRRKDCVFVYEYCPENGIKKTEMTSEEAESYFAPPDNVSEIV